jgi:hypothetical protein
MAVNIPMQQSSSVSVKDFFDNYFVTQVSFPAAEIDATVAFFQKRGFDNVSARSTAIVLLNQARSEGVSVFTLLDKLKSTTDVQLSQVVAQVLNSARDKTSLLGYRVALQPNSYDSRNILV